MRAKQEESDRQAAEVARLHATTPEQLYHADLDAFEAALDERDAEEAREAELLVTQRGRAGRAGGGKVGALAGCIVADQAALLPHPPRSGHMAVFIRQDLASLAKVVNAQVPYN